MIDRKKESVFTDKELVEAHVFASNLSVSEQKEVDNEMKNMRLQRLATMSNSQKLKSNLLGLKFQIEDTIQQNTFCK